MVYPKSILDIGIGCGKYGMLFREYLDVWKTDKPFIDRTVKIVGVEAFEGYRNPAWSIYDAVYVGNIFDMDNLLESEFDLIFMCDVIEHFEKEDAIALINSLKFKHILIVTPYDVKVQDAVYNNEYEIHKSVWRPSDMPSWKYELIDGIQIFRNFEFTEEVGNAS